MLQFARHQSTPVLTKGGTYDGWTADALAAPAVCWDGTQFVLTVSFWSVANTKWASGCFTSPDLVAWTYVTGSLRAPSGDDYIVGNGGIAWWGGKYWVVDNHYPAGNPAHTTVRWSTDLIAWTSTVEGTHIDGVACVDPSLAVNPLTDDLELWVIEESSRDTVLLTSGDGTTFVSQGVLHEAPAVWGTLNYGEPDVFYRGGVRYITFDVAVESGRRAIGQAASATLDATWATRGTVLGASGVNAWEAVNIFDSANVGDFNLNGRGLVRWLMYAGSDQVAATDNTNSSIGLAWMEIPSTGPALAVLTHSHQQQGIL
jgi:hypothetical protein